MYTYIQIKFAHRFANLFTGPQEADQHALEANAVNIDRLERRHSGYDMDFTTPAIPIIVRRISLLDGRSLFLHLDS